MKQTHIVQQILLLLFLFGLTACASHTTSTTLPGASEFKSTVWTLQTYGQAGNEKPVLTETTTTAMFDSARGMLSGNSGCNSYSASYAMNGLTLTISEIMSTMMACSEEIMRQERSYLTILEAAERYQIHQRQLQIFSRNDRTLQFTIK